MFWRRENCRSCSHDYRRREHSCPHAAAELVRDLQPLVAAINPNCFSSFDPECTCCCVALKQKLGAGGGHWGGLQRSHTVHTAHTDFPEQCNPGSSAACLYMSAPRCCHHTFSPKQHNYSGLSDRVQGSCLARPPGKSEPLIRKKPHYSDPVTDTGINEWECS